MSLVHPTLHGISPTGDTWRRLREQLITRNGQHVGLCIAAAIATVFVCYFEVLAATIRTWATYPMYSYVFVVPVVAGYVLWTTWPKEQPWRIAPDYWLGV